MRPRALTFLIDALQLQEETSPPHTHTPAPVCECPWLYHRLAFLVYTLFQCSLTHKWVAIFLFHGPETHVVLINSLSCCSAEVLSLDSTDSARTGCYTAQSPFYLGLEPSMSYLSFILYLESPFSLCNPKKRQPFASSCTWMASSLSCVLTC